MPKKSLREILLDFAMKSGAWNDKAIIEVDQAIQEIEEPFKERVELDEGKIAKVLKEAEDKWNSFDEFEKMAFPVAGIKYYAQALSSHAKEIVRIR